MAGRSFDSDIDDIINRVIPGEIAAAVRRTAIAIDQTLVIATPVGNPTLWKNPNSAPPGYVGGHARRNWLVSIGAPRFEEVAGTDPSGAAAINDGKNTIDAYSNTHALNGIAVYITNSVPYIGPLNDGWSTQAPSGFVEKAVQAGVAAGNGFVR